MEHFINSIELNEIGKITLFLVSSFLVMLWYYISFYFDQPKRDRTGLFGFLLFDNPSGTFDAIKQLVLVIAGGSMLGVTDNMSNYQIIAIALGVGLTAFSRRKQGTGYSKVSTVKRKPVTGSPSESDLVMAKGSLAKQVKDASKNKKGW